MGFPLFNVYLICNRLTIIHRNDVAIEKAQVLAKEHDIKASAYKVDGKRTVGTSEVHAHKKNTEMLSFNLQFRSPLKY